MFTTTHIVAGLVVGKLTGNYEISIISAVIPDLDHLIPFYKKGCLFNLKKFIMASTNKKDYCGDSRNYLHNIFLVSAAALIFSLFVSSNIVITIMLGLTSHYLLDALDDANFYPFYPNKKTNLKGPIKYFSLQEAFFSIFLFLIFILL